MTAPTPSFQTRQTRSPSPTTRSCLQMQKLISGPVYLELFVKVVPGWRSHPGRLAELGYRGD